MKDEQLRKIEELVDLVKHLPFWTEMFEPPTQADFKPTGYILVWINNSPDMVDLKGYESINRDTNLKPECWCRIVPPRPRTKNGK